MKKYEIYTNGNEKIAVKAGWSFTAFFFSGIWAMTKKMWLLGIATLGAEYFIIFSVPDNDKGAQFAKGICAIVSFVYGFKATKWWGASLKNRGFTHAGSVEAESPEQAIGKL